MSDQEIKKIPKVDKLLQDKQIEAEIRKYGKELIKYCIRKELEKIRAEILAGKGMISQKQIIDEVIKNVNRIGQPSLKPVINATGILLHTNLGRAPLGSYILSQLKPIIMGYSNLEFDLKTGKRGYRNDHVSNLLTFITGAENALVVNNNAAAVMLILKTLAFRKEVIISRGELIEIGGSFRIPEIMKASGAKMVEVGTTNRTKLRDYEEAISSRTRIILKAHKSNYHISGFTEEVDLEKLAQLAHQNDILMVYDLGSGLLRKPLGLPLENEPDVKTALKLGVDLVSFSGDKLLGGPQAGIIAGKDKLVKKLAKAPIMRALRVDKLTIAALTAAIRSYLNDQLLTEHLPLFNRFNRSLEEISALAQFLSSELIKIGIANKIIDSPAQVGGGSLPDLKLQSKAVKIITDKKVKARRIFLKLMNAPRSVLGILREGDLLLDVYALDQDDISIIISTFNDIIKKDKKLA